MTYIHRLKNIMLHEEYTPKFLAALPGLKDLGMDCCRSVKGSEALEIEKKLVADFPRVFGQLTNLSLRIRQIKDLECILPHTTSLRVLHIDSAVGHYHHITSPGMADDDDDKEQPRTAVVHQLYTDLVLLLERTLSKQLRELWLHQPPPDDETDAILFQSLSNLQVWPELDVFCTVEKTPNPLEIMDSRWPRFLENAWQASQAHRRWRFPFDDDPALNIYEAGLVQPGTTAALYQWMVHNCKNYEGEVKVDEFTQNTAEGSMESQTGFLNPSLATDRLLELEAVNSSVELKLRIKTIFPPSKKHGLSELLETLAPHIRQLTIQLQEVALGFWPGVRLSMDERYRMYWTARWACNAWYTWLMGFLPRCTRMHSFRLGSHTTGYDADLPLVDFRAPLATLCRDHALRHLDLDCAGLMQPATSACGSFPESQPPHPRRVIHMLHWISAPFTASDSDEEEEEKGSSFNSNYILTNLHTLVLHGLFILRPAEASWLLSVPRALPNLTRLVIDGLVWDPTYDEDDDEDEDEDDDNYGVDPRFSKKVDKELRMQRLREWLVRKLKEAAKGAAEEKEEREEGKADSKDGIEVRVDDLRTMADRTMADRMGPWVFRIKKEEKRAHVRRDLFFN